MIFADSTAYIEFIQLQRLKDEENDVECWRFFSLVSEIIQSGLISFYHSKQSYGTLFSCELIGTLGLVQIDYSKMFLLLRTNLTKLNTSVEESIFKIVFFFSTLQVQVKARPFKARIYLRAQKNRRRNFL